MVRSSRPGVTVRAVVTRHRRLTAASAVVAVLAFGWWFTDRRPFTPGATRSLLFAIVVLIVVGTARRRHDGSARAVDRMAHPVAGALLWGGLLLAVTAWELIALHGAPRSAHPTISSFVESAERYHLVRLAFYVAWIAFGWTIAA